MSTEQHQTQILYEIALVIGNGNCLEDAALNSLSIYLKKLNCFAGAIFQSEKIKDKCWYKPIISIPVHINRNKFFNEIIKDFKTKPSDCHSQTQDQPQFPVIRLGEENTLAIVMKLSDFGILVMLKKDKTLSESLIQSLKPINKKLGDSLQSYVDKQKLHIQSEVLEASSNSIMITDSKGYINWVNKAWCQTNGYNSQEVIGEYSNILKSSLNNKQAYKSMWATISNGEIYRGQLVNSRKDGSTYLSEITITPIKSSENKITQYISISQDITERMIANEALRESKERFEEMANLLPQPIWEIDTSGKLVYVNKAAFTIFGYTPEDVKNGLNFLQVISPEDRGRIKNLFKRKLSGEKLGDNEYLCLKKNGETFEGMIFSSPIFRNGIPQGVRGIVLDVTPLKQTKYSLERISSLQDILIKISTHYINIPTEKRDYAINNALKEMGLFVEADRAYIFDYDFQNQITINTFEWCREGIEPQIDNLKEVPLEAIPQWVDNHLKGSSIYVADVLSLDEHDDLRQVLEPQEIKSLIAVPMMDDSTCIGFLGFDSVRKHHSYTQKEKSILEVFAQIVVNLQNRYKSETQLKWAKEKAEKAEKSQFEFLSTMSHEIRTPLNAVIGLTNILLMESPKPEQLENLNTLKFSARNLMSIINDILDYNKLLSGNVVIDNHDFSLKELLDGMYLSMSSLASSKEIDIKYSLSQDTPEIVVGDSTRLLQIINNLVSNAIKFTHKGFVEITINHKGFTKGYHHLEFKIEDTGIGIPEDKYETIFEEFKQTSGAVTREYGGTGLGLPIVKQLLTMMGSEIQFTSEVGKGTTFSFVIQLKEGDPNKVVRYESILQFDMSLANIRVLLVEDNKINQMVALKFLHEWKCEVDTAENGLIALEKVEQKRYDVILMDLHMPVMDGYTATQKIRENPSYLINRTPIVALSASALGEIETKARNFGMNDFITKPFNPNALFKSLLNQTVVRKSKKR